MHINIESVSCGDGKGNDTIKWETYPLLDKTVKIYSFLNPDYPEFRTFEQELPISEGKAIISSSGGRNVRKYYYLLFDNTYSNIVSNRVIQVDSVLNVRDLGGYKTEDKKNVKWGKLYRAGHLNLKESGNDLFNSLRVKTIIDFRSDAERRKQKGRRINANVINIPINTDDISSVYDQLKNDEFGREDAIAFVEKAFKSMINDYQTEFSNMFEVMLEPSNYPLLMTCNSGNHKCGVAAALIFSALDIPVSQIIEDYLATYSIPDIRMAGSYAFDFSPKAQEAVTVLLSSDQHFMNITFQEIKNQYGSMDNYLQTAMNLDSLKRKKLQNLLLTN
ncbi:MAG: tyrosine-protein phosphatase [Candidatus Azobacteroides sp.]|nr:tyrosine-protein phosphatase [Candidatus Azobacteroides sp.]